MVLPSTLETVPSEALPPAPVANVDHRHVATTWARWPRGHLPRRPPDRPVVLGQPRGQPPELVRIAAHQPAPPGSGGAPASSGSAPELACPGSAQSARPGAGATERSAR